MVPADTGPRPMMPSEGSLAVLELLDRRGIAVAPHVASRLALALAGDAEAIVEVAAFLSPAQRSGIAALPDPLPLLGHVHRAVAPAAAELDAAERTVLLCAAICVDDRTDVLLTATELSMLEVIEGRVSSHLLLVAGHFTFSDPRMRVWVHGAATLGERTAAHAALARAYAATGDERMAVWHRSLSTLEGDRTLVPGLLDLARWARNIGSSEWAHSVAREAASHADEAEVDEARLTAGMAALDAGLVADAVEWLRGVVTSRDAGISARALPAYLHAATLHDGDVPQLEFERLSARLSEAIATGVDDDTASEIAEGLVNAAAVAACLLAELGSPDSAVDRLGAARRLADRHGVGASAVLAATEWCMVFGAVDESMPDAGAARDATPPDRDRSGAVACEVLNAFHGVARALRLGLLDDSDAGLRLLRAARGAPHSRPAPYVGGPDIRVPSPLVIAYRRVAAALLELWAGDVGRAAAGLSHAAAFAPVGLPFAGLGVLLARRLDVMTAGTVGLLARGLEAAHPAAGSAPLRTGGLVDLALSAYLAGRVIESGTLVTLAREREAQRESAPLHVPGLDEHPRWLQPVPSVTTPGALAVPTGMPPDQRRGAELRRSLCEADLGELEARRASAIGSGASLKSPLERGRVEFLLGRASTVLGDVSAARGHLLAAGGLFRAAGADAWAAAVHRDLSLLPSEDPIVMTGPIPVIDSRPAEMRAGGRVMNEAARAVRAPSPGADGPLDACRAEWIDILTEREFEVAMLVVDGASNREVARRLYVSVRTVEVHVGRVFAKLGVHTRVELAVLAHRLGGPAPARAASA